MNFRKFANVRKEVSLTFGLLLIAIITAPFVAQSVNAQNKSVGAGAKCKAKVSKSARNKTTATQMTRTEF